MSEWKLYRDKWCPKHLTLMITLGKIFVYDARNGHTKIFEGEELKEIFRKAWEYGSWYFLDV